MLRVGILLPILLGVRMGFGSSRKRAARVRIHAAFPHCPSGTLVPGWTLGLLPAVDCGQGDFLQLQYRQHLPTFLKHPGQVLNAPVGKHLPNLL
jgi:hypothetical protein